MIELSRNEVEALAAKASRGAGYSWGLADDIGRAARLLAGEGADWSASLLALLERAPGLAPPGAREGAPLCPVRMAAYLNDAPIETSALVLRDVALPVWLDALLRTQGLWRVETDLRAATADASLTRGERAAAPGARRAQIPRSAYEALNALAARLYVPESDRSRTRGAGGGRVDED
jgi:hypothetical protein